MNILVTAGATREPLDDVRFLSNVSTGRTGAALADALASRGHTVTLLRGQGAARPVVVRDVEEFSSTADLQARLAARLGASGGIAYDTVIMTAAVSDYRPEATQAGKISSDLTEMMVHLVRTPKLLPLLRGMASPRPLCVIGFKLTSGADATARATAVSAQFTAARVDAVVHNDLADIRARPESAHPFQLYVRPPSAGAPESLAGVPALAAALDALLRVHVVQPTVEA